LANVVVLNVTAALVVLADVANANVSVSFAGTAENSNCWPPT
jgi:hypothetical protein